MSVYKKPLTPFWQFDFKLDGRRFHGTLKDENGERLPNTVPKRRAQEREAVERAQARREIQGEDRPKEAITLDAAFGRYWVERGQYLPSADNIWDYCENWKRIGRRRHPLPLFKKNLHEITDDDIAWYMSKRRGETVRNRKAKTLADGSIVQPPLISARTANADLIHLRAVFARADDNWSMRVAKINWESHLLEEPEKATRSLSMDEDQRLFEAARKIRPDYADLIEFALIGGWRLSEVVMLEKRKIDRQAMTARVKVKGAREVIKALTVEMLEIIDRNWMNHPRRVFTYINQKNRTWRDKKTNELMQQRKGLRYPFTKNGWRKEWRNILKEAAIEEFRFHDLRHTLGTRVYAATRDTRAVQGVLDHKDPKTSERYIHVDFERGALEAAQKLRVPKKSRNDSEGGEQSSGGSTA